MRVSIANRNRTFKIKHIKKASICNIDFSGDALQHFTGLKISTTKKDKKKGSRKVY